MFVSYASASKEIARRLSQDLETGGCDSWFDDHKNLAGLPVAAEIEQGVNTSDVFVLVWSEEAASSPWVAAEVVHARNKKVAQRDGYLLIPLLLDNHPLPAGFDMYGWVYARDLTEYTNLTTTAYKPLH